MLGIVNIVIPATNLAKTVAKTSYSLLENLHNMQVVSGSKHYLKSKMINLNNNKLNKNFEETPMSELKIIAEVGQNHQGNLDLAIEYVEKFSKLGASIIKFQARNNKYLFDESRFNLNYDSPNSFGLTYGEHREKLEFKEEDLLKIKKSTENSNSKFCCTPFDEESLEMLIRINTDYIKVASFDMGNIPFLRRIGMQRKTTIISTGGANIEIIKESLKALDYGQDIFVLHCTSEYPCPAEKVNLSMIPILINQFPQYKIGISDHFNGTLTGPLARIIGAVAFEKHVTFDRSQKGSDHKFSLEPEGFRKFVRDIRRAEILFKRNDLENIGSEEVFERLGKSCVAAKDIKKGEKLEFEHISGRIFNKQKIPIRECRKIVGKFVSKNIKKGDPFEYDFITNV